MDQKYIDRLRVLMVELNTELDNGDLGAVDSIISEMAELRDEMLEESQV